MAPPAAERAQEARARIVARLDEIDAKRGR